MQFVLSFFKFSGIWVTCTILPQAMHSRVISPLTAFSTKTKPHSSTEWLSWIVMEALFSRRLLNPAYPITILTFKKHSLCANLILIHCCVSLHWVRNRVLNLLSITWLLSFVAELASCAIAWTLSICGGRVESPKPKNIIYYVFSFFPAYQFFVQKSVTAKRVFCRVECV